MDENALLRVIHTTRQHLLAEHGDIDPTPQKTRDTLEQQWGNERSLERYARVSWFGHDDSFGTAVANLVNTPRTLKLVLRHTAILWERLHGEICFDDLLVSMILRFGAGEAFDFLLRRIDILRMSKRDTNSDSDRAAANKQQEVIQADWNATIKKSAEWDSTAAQVLITFLFPNAAKCFGDERHVDFHVSPQGVQHWEPTNYWGRMLAGELATDELHDQTVLRRMNEWSESPSNSTVAKDLCSSSQFVQIWEYFADFLPIPNLLDLAGQVLDLLRQRDGAKASGDREAGAVIALWRRAHKTISIDDNSRDWLLDQINRSVEISLRLANDLYYYWASLQYGVVKTEQDRNIIRQALVEQTKQAFSAEKADALIRVLTAEYPYSIYQLIRPADQKEPPSILTQPSDWHWLSPILLNAASRAPAHVIPQIALLVTDSNHNSKWETHTQWNQSFLDGIFGTDMPRLMEILSTDFQMPSVPSDPAAEIKIENVRKLARHWLSEQPDQPNK